MSEDKYVIGVDYGTDSVRSVIVHASTGKEVAAATFVYPRWKKGLYCNAAKNQFRQHPSDYIEGLEQTVKQCLQQVDAAVRAGIKALSVDTTGSTPVAVNEAGVPLALLPEFSENPNAMFVLWKDHTAVKEAAEINAHAEQFEKNYLQYVGGIYSSEWFWAKMLHVLRQDEQVRNACYTWVEHSDWIPFLLTGGTKSSEIKRNVCAAGHKGLWSADFGGFPPEEFFATLDPVLAGQANRLSNQTYAADAPAGQISQEWAERLGLPQDMLIGIGAIDAHMGAVGGQIEPYHLLKVMGTSTCDMIVAPAESFEDTLVKGICGQVNGSIIPGMIGMEAGQSAFGDAFAWFKDLIAWPLQHLLSNSTLIDSATAKALVQETSDKILSELSKLAAQLPVETESELAVDWLNGRRTPDADQTLKAAFKGLSLSSDAPSMFKALVEATCFGARRIADRFVEQGVPVKGVIGIGGVAKKSPFVMQTMADVLGMPIKIHESEQTCALGAAMFAATVAGLYPNVQAAMEKMGGGFDQVYTPEPQKAEVYTLRYQKYLEYCKFIEFGNTALKETQENLVGAV